MTTAQWCYSGYLTALACIVIVFTLYCRACAINSRRWYWATACRAAQAEQSEKFAESHAARAAACEHSAICWVKAGRPQCEDDSDVLAAIMEEHNRRPIPADAANSDWGTVPLAKADAQ